MATVRKKVASVGQHHSPDGVVNITPERIRHWIAQHDAMTREGIKIPVPWGHQLSALPVEARDESYLASRYNAGYVERLEQDPADNSLVAVLKAPGLRITDGMLASIADLPGGQKVTTAIDEVSPAVGGQWTDGKGRVWRDIVAHVALTPKPVWAGQPPFQAMASANATGFFYLSTAGGDMEDDDKKKKDDPADDKELTAELMQPADDEPAGEEIPDDMTQPTNPPASPEQIRIDSLKAKLATLGVPLPETTDGSNILEHLEVALTVLAGKAELDAQKQAAVPPDEPLRKPEEAPMPGMMMSTIRANPALSKIVDNECKRQKRDWLDRIEALKSRGLPVHEANKLAAAATQTRLSLLPSGDLSQPELVRQIELLEHVLPPSDDPRQLLSTARAGRMPLKDDEPREKDTETGLELTETEKKEIHRRASRVSGGAAKA